MFYDVELTQLAQLVNSVNLFDAGYLFITTKDGVTIAHPNAENNGEKFSQFLPNVDLKEGTQRIELDGKYYLVKFAKCHLRVGISAQWWMNLSRLRWWMIYATAH